MSSVAKPLEPGPKRPDAHETVDVLEPVHLVLQVLARAPMGPADPPEIRAAIREGKELGKFVSGAAVSAELVRHRTRRR